MHQNRVPYTLAKIRQGVRTARTTIALIHQIKCEWCLTINWGACYTCADWGNPAKRPPGAAAGSLVSRCLGVNIIEDTKGVRSETSRSPGGFARNLNLVSRPPIRLSPGINHSALSATL